MEALLLAMHEASCHAYPGNHRLLINLPVHPLAYNYTFALNMYSLADTTTCQYY
jgi:hypothetical protein